jgi:peptidoglycan/LPS O-acetylase OafA/YrhL
MIENLQTLRAFAAINVVFFHIVDTSARYSYSISTLSFLEGWGANGVDIFFVISGFIMLYSQFVNKRNFIDFITSRAIRIVPLYWFLTTLVIVGFVVFPSAFRQLEITTGLAIASYFFASGAFFGSDPIVYVGWTLEWEMLFYLIFGLSFFFTSWKKSILFILLALAAVAAIASNMIILEFFGGLLIAIIYHEKIVSKRLGAWLLIVGCILLAVSLTSIVKELELNRVIIWGLPSLLIVLGAISIKQYFFKPIMFLGEASYSIYLVQMLSIPMFYKLVTNFELSLNADLIALMCLLFSVIAGAFLYALIETPVTKYLRVRFSSSKSNTLDWSRTST